MTGKDPRSYDTVAEAIRFVRASARRQPSLDEIGAHVGLSGPHLQRVFSRWAGISPKRFLQFLTKEHARHLLRQSRDVLSTSIETGLSGPGRLHDLMVSCEALTPGEIGALGEGLTLRFGFAGTPLGSIICGLTPRGVCHLQFVDAGDEAAAEAALRAEWPRAVCTRDDDAVAAIARQLFAPLAGDRPIALLLRGTNFQIKVWEALLRVPAGCAVSYGDLAGMADMPRAQRAVGTAIARNRIAVLVPCHRVIRESGEIGQYSWGSERKSALLAYESARDGEGGEAATQSAGGVWTQ
ncbi:MAG: bifunctional helix-turn-helix domain-containing protein/methylated-DNA--[protein]-cysteine S-methyltransferase [Rhodocyclales bacterium]|nr:bifunctional helix-turn-helix domain-containing protein/methylated-DNA--[protein]-cysteine S-methyltransferase [Rhodocyclales bacterium]